MICRPKISEVEMTGAYVGDGETMLELTCHRCRLHQLLAANLSAEGHFETVRAFIEGHPDARRALDEQDEAETQSA